MPAPDWHALQEAVAGQVVLPGAPDYESVRTPPVPALEDVRPAAVVLCRASEDVAQAIAFARGAGLPIAPRSGGHCFAGRSSTPGIVIDVSPLDGVSVAGGLATVGAGTRLGRLYDLLDEHGLTIAGGCGPTVGIAGLALGGGLGILGRRHGLTSDQLVAAQVVLADGRVVDCDDDRDADLFWALRGAGGGRFGVVTALVLRLLEAPVATTIHLVWPHTDAVALIDAWQRWAPAAPDELAASLLVTAHGDAAEPPAVHVFGAMLGGEADTAPLLEQFVARTGADPVSTALNELPFRQAKGHLAEHGPGAGAADAGPARSKSEFFARPLPREAIAALVEHFTAGRPAGQARELDFTPWGGAYNRVPAAETAFAHRDVQFLLKQAAAGDGARDWLERSWALVHPWGSGGVYPNFPDPQLADAARAYHGANLERLERVKASYDPDGVFQPLS